MTSFYGKVQKKCMTILEIKWNSNTFKQFCWPLIQSSLSCTLQHLQHWETVEVSWKHQLQEVFQWVSDLLGEEWRIGTPKQPQHQPQTQTGLYLSSERLCDYCVQVCLRKNLFNLAINCAWQVKVVRISNFFLSDNCGPNWGECIHSLSNKPLATISRIEKL